MSRGSYYCDYVCSVYGKCNLDPSVTVPHLIPHVDQGEPAMSLTHGPGELVRTQGGVTPGPEQGEPGADFTDLGTSLGAGVLLRRRL